MVNEPHELGPVKLDLLVYVAIIYCLLYLIIFKGIRSTGNPPIFGLYSPRYLILHFTGHRESSLGNGHNSLHSASSPTCSWCLSRRCCGWNKILLAAECDQVKRNRSQIILYELEVSDYWRLLSFRFGVMQQNKYFSHLELDLGFTLHTPVTIVFIIIAFGKRLILFLWSLKWNCLLYVFFRDCIITSAVNAFTSLFAGFVIFTFLGHMAHAQHQDISKVVTMGESC